MIQKTIVITGASDGIGLASAKQLKELGHNVIIVGRNKEKTEKASKTLNVPYYTVDYANLESVKVLAENLNKLNRIDVLCNNAGGCLGDRKITVNGFEQTFQVNVLGGFLLTKLLMDKLIESKAIVIQTTSIASNLFGRKLDINDLENENNYNPVKAYGESKLMDAILTKELDRRFGDKGIKAVAFEPWIVRSNFASESTWYFRLAFHTPLKYLFTISTEKSAKRLVRLASGTAGKDYKIGEFYSYKKPFKIKYKYDEKFSAKLWDKCEEMIQEAKI